LFLKVVVKDKNGKRGASFLPLGDDKTTQKCGSDSENYGTVADGAGTESFSTHRINIFRACSIKIHQVAASHRAVRSRS